jgi:hypothetical protein
LCFHWSPYSLKTISSATLVYLTGRCANCGKPSEDEMRFCPECEKVPNLFLG